MDKLNKNQKAFIQEYIKNGANATQAYLKVYKTKNENTAKANASKLLTLTNIQEYLKELQSKVETKAIMSIEERKQYLTKVVKEDELETGYTLEGKEYKKKPNFKTKLGAIDILNKMDGAYTTNINIDAKVKTSKIDDLIENIDKLENK